IAILKPSAYAQEGPKDLCGSVRLRRVARHLLQHALTRSHVGHGLAEVNLIRTWRKGTRVVEPLRGSDIADGVIVNTCGGPAGGNVFLPGIVQRVLHADRVF